MHFATVSTAVFLYLKLSIIKMFLKILKCFMFPLVGSPFTPSSCDTNPDSSFKGQIWRFGGVLPPAYVWLCQGPLKTRTIHSSAPHSQLQGCEHLLGRTWAFFFLELLSPVRPTHRKSPEYWLNILLRQTARYRKPNHMKNTHTCGQGVNGMPLKTERVGALFLFKLTCLLL